MNHSNVRNRLSDHLERNLPPSERREVEAHLESCTACAQELLELERTVLALRRLPDPETPAYLTRKVMARIADGEGAPASWSRWLERLAQPALALPMAAALAGFVAYVTLPDAGPSGSATHLAQMTPPPSHNDPGWGGVVSGTSPEMRGDILAASDPSAAAERRLRARQTRRLAFREASQDVARRLRGVGHPHSEMMADHFQRPDEAAFVTFTPR